MLCSISNSSNESIGSTSPGTINFRLMAGTETTFTPVVLSSDICGIIKILWTPGPR